MKQVKPRKTTRRSEAPAKQTDEEADDFEISEPKDFEENSDPLGRKEFVVRDQ